MLKKIRVVVIDDSAFMRKVLSDIISSDGRCEVVAKASNGIEGIDIIKEFSPDVITVDVEMPKMNGIEMLRELYKTKKIPAIMVSSITKEGAKETLEALHLGAVDFITKPENIFSINSDQIKKDLVNKIIEASKIPSWKIQSEGQTITTKQLYNISSEKNKMESLSDSIDKLIVIGTSTGGPKALQKVLTKIPSSIDAPILIVQHMPKGFTASLASRLDSICSIIVKEAEHNETIKKGVAYIAPGDKHLLMKKISNYKYKLVLDDSAPVKGHRPCYDVTLGSVSEEYKNEIAGVIMTGMGSDGADGLELLKNRLNAYIIAEDEESCVVYGMPKAVVEKGIADEVASLSDISSILKDKIGVM